MTFTKQDEATEIFDTYTWQEEKQVITNNVHKLSGLGNFTHWKLSNSEKPTPLHFHSGMIEIHCMVKGQRISMLTNNNSPKTYTLVGNEIFITFPYELHSTGPLPQTPCEFYALQLDTRERDHLLCLSRDFSNALCDRLLSLKHRHLLLSKSSLQQIRTAFHLFSSRDSHDFHTGVSYLVCFLHSLLYLRPVEDEIVRSIEASIQKAISFIDANYDKPLVISELADISGYSVSHFKEKFKKEVGITPTVFITMLKIEKAKPLLETTNISVTELAFKLGFSSSNYFCSVFKKYTGVSPYQFRLRRYPEIQL